MLYIKVYRLDLQFLIVSLFAIRMRMLKILVNAINRYLMNRYF
jgi:hypothetical protein